MFNTVAGRGVDRNYRSVGMFEMFNWICCQRKSWFKDGIPKISERNMRKIGQMYIASLKQTLKWTRGIL